MVSGTVDQYSRIGGPITDEDGNVLDNSYEWKNVGSTDVTRHLNFAGFGFGGMFFLGIVPQNSGTTVTPCSGPIPEAAGRAILIAADSAHIDPTLLSVTWRHESGFDTMPFPNPRKQNGKIVGYDVGPLQLSTNYYDRSPFTDGLTKAFTGTSFRFPNAFGPGSPNLNNFGADIRFNGDTSQNLLAGARAFAEDILPRSKGLADAAGLYRAGNRSGPYQSRFDQYTNETAADSVYLNCLRGQK